MFRFDFNAKDTTWIFNIDDEFQTSVVEGNIGDAIERVNLEDNGIGFPENRDKLFEPYITNKINGTGLGLAICKKIIEDHGGEINLLDSKEYGGACVRLKFIRV